MDWVTMKARPPMELKFLMFREPRPASAQSRFIKRTSSTKSGEEVADLYELDKNVIEEEEKYDGYYAVKCVPYWSSFVSSSL